MCVNVVLSETRFEYTDQSATIPCSVLFNI